MTAPTNDSAPKMSTEELASGIPEILTHFGPFGPGPRIRQHLLQAAARLRELEAEKSELRASLVWAMGSIGGRPRLIKGQNDQYFEGWHKAHALAAERNGGAA